MDGIRIIQIYLNIDLRNGDKGLGAFLIKKRGTRQQDMKTGEVFVFWNRARNLVKIMAKDSILVQRLKGANRRWDPAVDRNELFILIGRAFNLSWNVSAQVYSQVQKAAGIK
jgi:hypothetical protein